MFLTDSTEDNPAKETPTSLGTCSHERAGRVREAALYKPFMSSGAQVYCCDRKHGMIPLFLFKCSVCKKNKMKTFFLGL